MSFCKVRVCGAVELITYSRDMVDLADGWICLLCNCIGSGHVMARLDTNMQLNTFRTSN